MVIHLAKRKTKSNTQKEITELDGVAFECYLMDIFNAQGYEAKSTPPTGDFGVDLLLSKNGTTTAVQAKQWRGTVGVEAIQQVVAGQGYYKCKASMVVISSSYTPQARALAKENNVTLWVLEDVLKAALALDCSACGLEECNNTTDLSKVTCEKCCKDSIYKQRKKRQERTNKERKQRKREDHIRKQRRCALDSALENNKQQTIFVAEDPIGGTQIFEYLWGYVIWRLRRLFGVRLGSLLPVHLSVEEAKEYSLKIIGFLQPILAVTVGKDDLDFGDYDIYLKPNRRWHQIKRTNTYMG